MLRRSPGGNPIGSRSHNLHALTTQDTDTWFNDTALEKRCKFLSLFKISFSSNVPAAAAMLELMHAQL